MRILVTSVNHRFFTNKACVLSDAHKQLHRLEFMCSCHTQTRINGFIWISFFILVIHCSGLHSGHCGHISFVVISFWLWVTWSELIAGGMIYTRVIDHVVLFAAWPSRGLTKIVLLFCSFAWVLLALKCDSFPSFLSSNTSCWFKRSKQSLHLIALSPSYR